MAPTGVLWRRRWWLTADGGSIEAQRHLKLLQLQPDPGVLSHAVGEKDGRRDAAGQQVHAALGQIVELDPRAAHHVVRHMAHHDHVSWALSRGRSDGRNLVEASELEPWRTVARTCGRLRAHSTVHTR